MKYSIYLSIAFLTFFFTFSFAQKNVNEVIKNKVILLNKAIFEKKDSLALESLIGKDLIYGHSAGKVENRSEMIKGVLANKSVYQNVVTDVQEMILRKKFIVVRHIITALETNGEGKQSTLKMSVVQVWEKNKKDWLLLSRQSAKLPQ